MTEETKTPKEDLFQKIMNIQWELSVKKDGKNPFYKSEYITLDNLMDKLQPLLDKEWLMVYNVNIVGWVRTVVTDLNYSISSDFTIEWLSDPQALWKVVTYWRRYNLTSIFNVLADEDDDAQSFYEKKKPATKKAESRFQKAISNVEFMRNCLDQNDFINKIKNKYELDEFQESQLRTAYQNATTESDLDLPFIDE